MLEQKGHSFFVHFIFYAQTKAKKQHKLAYMPAMTETKSPLVPLTRGKDYVVFPLLRK
jgi:hypothetical protein